MTSSGYVILVLILVILTALVVTPACCHIVVLGASLIGLTQFRYITKEFMSDDMAQTETSDSAQVVEKSNERTGLNDRMWDNHSEVVKLFSNGTDETKVSGDDRILAKKLEIGDRNKQAMLARTRFTSDNFRRYFVEELEEEENRHWWEHDELDAEMNKKFDLS